MHVSTEKGGALRTVSVRGKRALVGAAGCGLLLGVPLLLQSANAAPGAVVAPAATRHQVSVSTPPWELVRYQRAAATTTTTVPPTTTTTAPPTTTTTVPPTTTTSEAPTAVTTPPPPPPTTTTTTAPPPPPEPQETNSETGDATWYSEAPDGMCASPTLPFGTVLTVTNVATGASTTCTVDDREADNPGRVVDMSYSGFAQIADPSQGVVTVTVSW